MDSQFPVDRMPSLRTLAMPADANPRGDIFGGWIMSQMDLAGAIYASHIVRGRLVTVAVDGMTFHQPVYVGDQVSCYCDISRTGNTSVSVHIETWVRRKEEEEQREHHKVTEATFTYVSIDKQRRPVKLEKRP